ncbi:MAG: hypothetical protein GPJ52_00065 [Candidatus Heimdallarchaeota archaeon]|nr:hypothetical protein [Candidatus Heimdallarchaeota archaeon]
MALTSSNLMTSAETKIADGKKVLVLQTRGIYFDVDPLITQKVLEIAKQKLVGKVTWVVFSQETKKCEYQDQGRTVLFPLKWLSQEVTKKIYVILDDYGSVEALRKSANDSFINTQYVLTILYAEEY